MPEINQKLDPASSPGPKFDIKEALEVASKTLVMLVGLCYVLGLLVNNLHLSRYGYSSLSLLQLNYVFAGFWTLLPIIFGVLAVNAVSAPFSEDFKEREKLKALLDQIENARRMNAGSETKSRDADAPYLSFGGVALTPPLASYGEVKIPPYPLEAGSMKYGWKKVIEDLPPKKKFLESLMLLALVVSFILMAGSAIEFQFTLRWVWASLLGLGAGSIFVALILWFFSPYEKVPVRGVLLFLPFFALYLMWYLGYFARNVYKDIPAGVGGGRPALVRFLVEKEAKPYFDASGLPVSEQDYRSEPVELLLDSADGYVVKLKGTERVAVFPRAPVKVVFFERQ